MLKTIWKIFLKYILPYILIGGVLAGLWFWVSAQMQEMQTDLREDTVAPVDGTQTRPGRETVAHYWDSEDLVAQQIFRSLQLKRPENTQMILTNVEANLQYNRNKAAVYFYLAAAYEQLNNPERASGFYAALMQDFNNRNITLAAFNQKLLTEDIEKYSVAIQEEAALRLALLYKRPGFTGTAPPDGLFLFLQDSKNTFGPENKPGFLYADLAPKGGRAALADLISSEDYSVRRLTAAQDYLQKFISAVQSNDPQENILAGKMVAESASRTLAAEYSRLRMAGMSPQRTLTLDSIRKDRDDYLYIFIYNEADLKFTLRDDLRGALIIERIQK